LPVVLLAQKRHLPSSKVFARLKYRSCCMNTRRTVRKWQVIAAEVSKERNHERFEDLLKELSEALNVGTHRKLKVEDVPRVSNKIAQFPLKATPSR
jgi:hypothetical protein